MPISFKIPAAVFRMILPSEQRFWVSALSTAICFLSAASAGLRYNYGDGSFYVGQVDEKGRPDGVGKYFNTTGELGKYSTGSPFLDCILLRCAQCHVIKCTMQRKRYQVSKGKNLNSP